MTEHPSDKKPLSDAALQNVLGAFAPMPPLTRAKMQKLEADILAQARMTPQDAAQPQEPLFAFMFRRGWTPRAAALMAVLVLVGGYIVGQVSYGDADINLPLAGSSIMALASQSLSPADLTDMSWRDTDDDDE